MTRKSSLVLGVVVLAVGACGSDGADGPAAGGGRPSIVVTTGILGDVVENLVGDLATVEVVMPRGASPHEFQASAQQATSMRSAALLVTNGGGFEEGLLDTIEAATADGVATFEAMSAVDALELGDGHGDAEETPDDRGHDGVDPHFFTDPSRMVTVARALVEFMSAELPTLVPEELRRQADPYLEQLRALDTEVEQILDAVPAGRRLLVTNHEVFGYFADRYGFEVLGVVIPGGGTQAEPSAKELAALAQAMTDAGVAAVFADTSSPGQLAAALASEVGDAQVVDLFGESLGEPGSGAETYLEMVRTNARRIAEALAV